MDIESAQAITAGEAIAKFVEELSSSFAEDNSESNGWWASHSCSKYCEAGGYPHSNLTKSGECVCSGTRLWLPLPRR